MIDMQADVQNYALIHNWREQGNKIQLRKITGMSGDRQFIFRRKARTSLIKATDMLPLRKLLGSKTKGHVVLTEGNHWTWRPNNKTQLLTLQVLVGLLPEGDLLPFLQYFCDLDVADADIASREIAKDNLYQLERKNTNMRGKALKSVFWAGTPSSTLRKSSDDLLAVARAVCVVSYSKVFTRGLLTEDAQSKIDRTTPLTNFSIKELKSMIMPIMSMSKISNCLSFLLLSGWLVRIPEKYTVAGAKKLANKEAEFKAKVSLKDEINDALESEKSDDEDSNQNGFTPKVTKDGYIVAPSIYIMNPIDSVDWENLLDTVNLDTTASIRPIMVNYILGSEYATQFINHNKQTIMLSEISVAEDVKGRLEANPNDCVTKKQMAVMLQHANTTMKGNTALQHLKDLLVWKHFNLVEITSREASILGFNAQKRTMTDKVLVNYAEYLRRK
ncbi:hypothetical protein PT285_11075 [Lactobacillus sp. ESL0791]|uniref:hypothetical protein n=1 Tax=Lactobacillus sp. ESL0791 TaxID=2983234 RepID=UPI0023F883B2|nr:hypothetical protein [Lactobacillus sp. ESL0791]MDF7639943.1 hypothetical protein [Lactobacillus sp. ESL0791]